VKSVYTIAPLTLEGVRRKPPAERPGKITVRDFARPHRRGARLPEFLSSLPNVRAGTELREVIAAVLRARVRQRMILWGLSGQVLRDGLGSLIADLIDHGFVGGIAMDGATLVHDFETAVNGKLSDDGEVAGPVTSSGSEETGVLINEMAAEAVRRGIGLGEAAGRLLVSGRVRVKHGAESLLIAAYQERVPVTVHLAIGVDTPDTHRTSDGASLGAASHHDFRLLCALVQQMHTGGVYLNWSSTAVVPESFLKAASLVRNLGVPLEPITTANFDLRGQGALHSNSNGRRAGHASQGERSRNYAIAGHHEIMLPLVAAALIEGASGVTMASRRSSKLPAR
jgi:hypothetical protein